MVDRAQTDAYVQKNCATDLTPDSIEEVICPHESHILKKRTYHYPHAMRGRYEKKWQAHSDQVTPDITAREYRYILCIVVN